MADKFCFVVMGFGKKIDYAKKPRTLDMDKAYEAIIEPAVKAAGLRCVRSDRVQQSGIIDQGMYEMLLRADLVVADISTANPNAIYELGVRHALRPYSTIVIKEQDGNFHFDLNHIATLQYKHLGDDIGHSEAKTKSADLEKLIRAVLAKSLVDSPVYTYLRMLKQPMMSEAELDRAVRDLEAQSNDGCAGAVAAGRAAAAASRHAEARDCFQRACDLQRKGDDTAAVDPFILQQLALHTYKAKEPNALEALRAAQGIIGRLDPGDATDTETLGIAGAIFKRLAESEPDKPGHLEAAVEYYGRGFWLKGDYYNGENYALCLDLRAGRQQDPAEALYDRTTARKVRVRVRESVARALADPTATERSDYNWLVATIANTAYALGDLVTGQKYEALFRSLGRPAWEIETFEGGKRYAAALAKSGEVDARSVV